MSNYTPTLDEIVEAVVYHQTREEFDGMGTVGRKVAVSRVYNWLAEERAEARREAVAEFAKQHGIGDLESRPLYDAQQQLADSKSEIEHLRTVERRLEAQVINAKAEALREAAGDFAFTDDMWRDYQGLPDQGYSHRDFLEHVVGKWLRDRAAELEGKR